MEVLEMKQTDKPTDHRKPRIRNGKKVVKSWNSYTLDEYIKDIADGVDVEVDKSRFTFGRLNPNSLMVRGNAVANGSIELEVNGRTERAIRYGSYESRNKIMEGYYREVKHLTHMTIVIILKPD